MNCHEFVVVLGGLAAALLFGCFGAGARAADPGEAPARLIIVDRLRLARHGAADVQ